MEKNGKRRMTVTDVANAVGVTPKTVVRWEKSGKIRRPRRDWRGWRVYSEGDLRELMQFYEALSY